MKLIVENLGTNLFPHQVETICAEHTKAIHIVKGATVGNIRIQRFQQTLLSRVELNIQFFLNTFKNVVLFTEIVNFLIGNIRAHNIKQI